ncbi:MAG: helix-turn-helix domain-containing protein [Thermoleophilia bacterium]
MARARRRMSKSALAASVDIAPSTMTGYESGDHLPPAATVQALADKLRFPVGFLTGTEVERLTPDYVSFRALSRLRARDRDAAIAAGSVAVLIADWIEGRFDLPKLDLPELRNEDPESAAEAVRAEWRLGEGAISNIVHLLEARGIRVFSLQEDCADVDAFCFWQDGLPYVLLNMFKSAERSRFDAAHELAHLVLHRHETLAGRKQVESEAQRFASAFLMPARTMRGVAPASVTLDRLLALKQLFGVSAAAVAVRLHQLGLLGDWNYRMLFQQMSARGWRSQEPHPMGRERSLVHAQVVAALRAEAGSKKMIADDLGLPLAEVESLTFGLGEAPSRGAGWSDPSPTRPTNPGLRLVDD